jgi:hypothetical protein
MMSAAPATPAAALGGRRTAGRSAMSRWVAGGLLAIAALTAVVIALVWPSEADKARADGERYGEAVAQLAAADTATEVDAALVDVRDAAADTRDHAGDAVAGQVADQQDALDRAVDGFVGSRTSDDAFEADLYEAELDIAVDDLTTQADDFRAQGSDVQQAFWDGYQDGVNAD